MPERNLKLEECELFGVAQESCLTAIDAASIASAPHSAFIVPIELTRASQGWTTYASVL